MADEFKEVNAGVRLWNSGPWFDTADSGLGFGVATGAYGINLQRLLLPSDREQRNRIAKFLREWADSIEPNNA